MKRFYADEEREAAEEAANYAEAEKEVNEIRHQTQHNQMMAAR